VSVVAAIATAVAMRLHPSAGEVLTAGASGAGPTAAVSDS
jgi:hypothetical protein